MEIDRPAGRAKRIRTKITNKDFVDISKQALDSDEEDELYADTGAVKMRRLEKGRVKLLTNNNTRRSSRVASTGSSRPPSRAVQEESSDSDPEITLRRGTRARVGTRASGRIASNTSTRRAVEDDNEDELADDAQEETDDSDIQYVQKGAKKAKNGRNRSKSQGRGRGRPRLVSETSSSEPEQPTRRSGRERVIKSMKERDADEEIYADDVAKINTPKVISIREIYQPLPKQSPFRVFHNNTCDVCKGTGNSSNKGTSPLIYCQGCSTSIHKNCLGYRSGREHMVTKIGHENFVLQCRRCIGIPNKKDSSAPPLDICQGCKKPGPACKSFSVRKTAKQEEKLREENDGTDPITEVADELINNPYNVLFRCTRCQRPYHFEHLPGLKKTSKTPEDLDELRIVRLKEYVSDWQCKDCCEASKPETLVAWRPVDAKSCDPEDTVDMFSEDQKEYLVKWEDQSYFQCAWMPGSWVWGVTAKTMRNAFTRRDEGINEKPRWTEKEAIPEEYLTMEIIFDVEYDDEFEPESEESDKAGISMINQVYVKFEGLTYDDVVWEEPPSPDDTDRWSAFVKAYNEYLAGKYFKHVPTAVLKERVDQFRSLNLKKKIGTQTKQPSEIAFPMYKYQMEGFNWLLQNFHQQKNVILADEMGLGKTVQLIALMAFLVKDRPKVCH